MQLDEVMFYCFAGFVAGAVCVWCAWAHAVTKD
jgi:hypothetical protein